MGEQGDLYFGYEYPKGSEVGETSSLWKWGVKVGYTQKDALKVASEKLDSQVLSLPPCNQEKALSSP